MTILTDTTDILADLISFPTVSPDSNLDMINYIAEYLHSLGARVELFPDPTGAKANLFATLGPDMNGGIMLSGHSDVVPVTDQTWSSDPFKMQARDGRLYGRGTCDMKGFDAIALTAVPKALKRGIKRPIQIAMSYDEEVGCIGAPFMAAEMAKLMPKASAAIIGEPSMMKAVTGHKGGNAFTTHVVGFEVHSSIHYQGVSAVHESARLIQWANEQNELNRAATPGPLAAMFDPPYTTWHVGTISGGTAENITAKNCHFSMGYRAVPGDDPARLNQLYFNKVNDVRAAMQAVHPEADIVLTPRFAVPPLEPEEDGAAEGLVRAVTGDNASHVVSYGTEAGQFQDAGYSAVVCGPGDIAQAHQPNEFIMVSQFEAGHQFMCDLLAKLA